MEKCYVLQDRREIVGQSAYTIEEGTDLSCECLREMNHNGPHLIKNHNGKLMIWYVEFCSPEEDCESCRSEDPLEWCITYGEVDRTEAQKLIEDRLYKGNT